MSNNAYMSGTRLGRKPFLGLVMVGKLAGAAFNLLNAVYLDTWSRWVGLLYTCTPVHLHTCTVHLNRWVWLGTVMLVQSFSGGFLAFIMMTYSFIADNSTQRWV